jgi:tRNA-dihydrouridine synthase
MEVEDIAKPFLQNKIPLYLAPMAGITDMPFRYYMQAVDVDVMITEMISTRRSCI